MKKVFAIVLAFVLSISSTVAMAASVSESFTGKLYYKFPDGTMNVTNQVIGTAAHSYLVKTNTSGLYSGAIDQGTTCRAGSRTTSITKSSNPVFSTTVSSDHKKITVRYSGGSVQISYHDMIIVDSQGNQTLSSDVATHGASFNATKTHTK